MQNQSIVALLVSLLLAFPALAKASQLDLAIADYNTKAAAVESAWDSFQQQQSDAFELVEAALTNLYHYYEDIGDDPQQDALQWNAHLAAWFALEYSAGAAVDSALNDLLAALEEACDALDEVENQDRIDRDYVAYHTGVVHFSLPSDPFLFWYDDADPEIDEWVEMDFPVLAKGDATLHSSFLSGANWQLKLTLHSMWGWASLGYWIGKHKNTGSNINNSGATLLDAICAHCDQLTIYAINYDDCITPEKVNDICEDTHEYDILCNSTYDNNQEKNATISRKIPCLMFRNLQEVVKVAEDHVKPWWHSELPGLFE